MRHRAACVCPNKSLVYFPDCAPRLTSRVRVRTRTRSLLSNRKEAPMETYLEDTPNGLYFYDAKTGICIVRFAGVGHCCRLYWPDGRTHDVPKGRGWTPPFLGLRRELRPGSWIAEIRGRISQPDDPKVACNHYEHFAIGDQPRAWVKVSRFHGLTGMMIHSSGSPAGHRSVV